MHKYDSTVHILEIMALSCASSALAYLLHNVLAALSCYSTARLSSSSYTLKGYSKEDYERGLMGGQKLHSVDYTVCRDCTLAMEYALFY